MILLWRLSSVLSRFIVNMIWCDDNDDDDNDNDNDDGKICDRMRLLMW